MKEEQIKGKVVLPYLHELGFDVSEISLEDSFSIRLGRTKHVITGRSDILCKRNDSNLFVIEIKSDEKTITQDDIDQGISYARLLDNIAPFVIVTNSKTTRIFDSVSKEELTGKSVAANSDFWKNGCTLSTEYDLQIRYEALSKFVALAPDNLQLFCKDQVRTRMGTIVGDIDTPYAKFITELYIQRENLQLSFSEFLRSDQKVFGIVGDAGVGKTNAMCAWALSCLADHFVFFYNAGLLNSSPLHHIAQDLGIVYSGKMEKDGILKKLDTLGRSVKKQVLIFIDAVDENTDDKLPLELSEIALALRKLTSIKICISCKASRWKSVLVQKENPTHLYEELKTFHPIQAKLDKTPGFLLEPFDEAEFQKVLPLYKKVFQFKGEISPSVALALKNAFFLRIFSEVYRGQEIPQEINDQQLLGTYVRKALEKLKIGFPTGIRILAKIGKILMGFSYNYWDRFKDSGMEMQQVMDKLELPLHETIPEDLFAGNLLIRSNSNNSFNISFYYSKVRDYIICYHTYKLDTCTDDEFYNLLEHFYENHIGESAIKFYMENATAKQYRLFGHFKIDKFRNYVNSYNAYLETHFKRFKEKFDPKTHGEIGILVPEDLSAGDGYGLIRLSGENAPKVQFERSTDFMFVSADVFFERGLHSWHSSHINLLRKDQQKAVEKELFRQLKKIVEEGKLNAYNADALLLEQTAAIIYFYSRELGYDLKFKDHYLPRYENIYPIDLVNLKQKIYKFRVTEYYKRQYKDKITTDANIARAIEDATDIPKLNITGDFPPIEELGKIVDLLLDRGYQVITKHHLPYPDIPVTETSKWDGGKLDVGRIREQQFTSSQAKLYIETFLKLFDEAYADFVNFNFPTLKNRFPFYTSGPHEYFVYMKDEDLHKWGQIGYRKSTTGILDIHFKIMTASDEPFKNGETTILWGFVLNHILHNGYYGLYKTIDGFRTPKLDDYCVLRHWVLSVLQDDLKEIFKEYDA